MADGILTRGAGRKTIHLWKKYNVNTSTTYWWNTYNVVSTTTYKWNKYSVEQSTVRAYYLLAGGTNKYGHTIAWTYMSSENGNGYWSSYSVAGTSSRAWFVASGSLIAMNSDDATFGSYTIGDNKKSLYQCRTREGGHWLGSCLFLGDQVWGDDKFDMNDYVDLSIGDPIKGSTSYGQVTSTNSNAYPANGASGSYWYESAGSSTSKSKGSTSYGYVTSSSRYTYPDNSYSGDRWYVYDNAPTTNYSMGSYIEDVLSTDPNKYPANSRSGSYWYVYQGQL